MEHDTKPTIDQAALIILAYLRMLERGEGTEEEHAAAREWLDRYEHASASATYPGRPVTDDGQRDAASAGLSTPEPPPVRTDGRPVWDLVIDDMRQRDAEGRRKYGVPLQAHNGRDALVDAYQEALDLSVYLRQAIEEARGASPSGRPVLPEGARLLDPKHGWEDGLRYASVTIRCPVPSGTAPLDTMESLSRSLRAVLQKDEPGLPASGSLTQAEGGPGGARPGAEATVAERAMAADLNLMTDDRDYWKRKYEALSSHVWSPSKGGPADTREPAPRSAEVMALASSDEPAKELLGNGIMALLRCRGGYEAVDDGEARLLDSMRQEGLTEHDVVDGRWCLTPRGRATLRHYGHDTERGDTSTPLARVPDNAPPRGFREAFRGWWRQQSGGVDPGLGLPTEVEPGYPHKDMCDAYEAFEAGRLAGIKEWSSTEGGPQDHYNQGHRDGYAERVGEEIDGCPPDPWEALKESGLVEWAPDDGLDENEGEWALTRHGEGLLARARGATQEPASARDGDLGVMRLNESTYAIHQDGDPVTTPTDRKTLMATILRLAGALRKASAHERDPAEERANIERFMAETKEDYARPDYPRHLLVDEVRELRAAAAPQWTDRDLDLVRTAANALGEDGYPGNKRRLLAIARRMTEGGATSTPPEEPEPAASALPVGPAPGRELGDSRDDELVGLRAELETTRIAMENANLTIRAQERLLATMREETEQLREQVKEREDAAMAAIREAADLRARNGLFQDSNANAQALISVLQTQVEDLQKRLGRACKERDEARAGTLS